MMKSTAVAVVLRVLVASCWLFVGWLSGGTPGLSIRWFNGQLEVTSQCGHGVGVATLLRSPDPGLPLREWEPVASFPADAGVVATRVSLEGVGGDAAPGFFQLSVVSMTLPERMHWIPGGIFRMGSPTTDPLGLSPEWPRHEVRIGKGFWMSRYEERQAEYEAVMGSNPSVYVGDATCPVENVSWEMAMAYFERLTESERA